MILRGLPAWAEDIEAVCQCRRDQRDCRDVPVVVTKPIRNGAPDTCDHVQPDAMVGSLGLRRLVQEVGNETRKNHHRDPVVNGLHS